MTKYAISLLALLATAGCFGTPKAEKPPTPPAFVMDDCALISTIGHDRYKLTSGSPTVRLKLVGEGLAWQPGCNWKSLGFNVVEDSGPESRAATKGLGEVTISRPRYDAAGVLVRTSNTPPAGQADLALCRLVRKDSAWSIESCGPDPKQTQPAAPPPSPSDATPESTKIPAPLNRPPTARDANTYTPDPGGTRAPGQ